MECVIYFEDYQKDVLSKLYTSAYEEENASIRFSGGNGKLAPEMERLLYDNPEVFIIAVLDMVPENSDIVTIYNHLKMIGNCILNFKGDISLFQMFVQNIDLSRHSRNVNSSGAVKMWICV
ncbi:hypothetical protein D3Z62_27585 [Lachnospiraceae bacterium]|nr:hypothetical protein [Lachnospiraceae bacterium]